jgi:hypothetical protein
VNIYTPEMTKRAAIWGEAQAWALEAARHVGDDCLLWPFRAEVSGYGAIHIDGRRRRAPRYICELAHGKPPAEKMECAHTCGERMCCNPRHLRWATRIENERDKILHGRTNRGERNGQAKLTHQSVQQMRALRETGETFKSIAKQFGVSTGAAHRTISGAHWKHVRND